MRSQNLWFVRVDGALREAMMHSSSRNYAYAQITTFLLQTHTVAVTKKPSPRFSLRRGTKRFLHIRSSRMKNVAVSTFNNHFNNSASVPNSQP